MNKSKALSRFIQLYETVMAHPTHYTGFYTDGIALSKDLISYLTDNNLLDTCTELIHVLQPDGSMQIKRCIRPFINIKALTKPKH